MVSMRVKKYILKGEKFISISVLDADAKKCTYFLQKKKKFSNKQKLLCEWFKINNLFYWNIFFSSFFCKLLFFCAISIIEKELFSTILFILYFSFFFFCKLTTKDDDDQQIALNTFLENKNLFFSQIGTSRHSRHFHIKCY